MLLITKRVSDKAVLRIGYLYIILVMIDAPLVTLYTISGSALIVRLLLYASEAIILGIFGYLLIRSQQVRPPLFIFIFVTYIFLMALVGLIFCEPMAVIRDARRYIAPLPPFLVGCYFARGFGSEQEKIIKKIVIFLTILSIISLFEWILFFAAPGPMTQLYSKYFRSSGYYHHVKQHVVEETETGLTRSGNTQSGNFIYKLGGRKRATGLYLEGYSAGFNAASAIILLLYFKVAGYKRIKHESVIVVINTLAVILATSRSAYLFLFLSLFMYSLIRRHFRTTIFICLLPFLYYPFTEWCINSIQNLGGGIHQEAIISLPSFVFEHLPSFEGLIGKGVGSSKEYIDAGAYKEILLQLGLAGLISYFFLYLSIFMRIPSTRPNRFFVCTIAIGISILCIYSGRIFGYKCIGLLHFFLGYNSSPALKRAPVVSGKFIPRQLSKHLQIRHGQRNYQLQHP